jgi:FlaG/FlaF family flagellin (archaellin)
VKKLKKIIGNKKGIDTILAALLMVVIVVVASVMVYAWSTGLLGTLLVTPSTGKEAMNIENNSFNSVYNVTLDLRNTGSVSITLNSYYVKDSSGNQWSRLTWQTDAGGQHPAAITPNALGIVYVSIGTGATGTGGQCGASCTPTGTFTQFNTGFSYTVVVVTSRNNQFSFTVTK